VTFGKRYSETPGLRIRIGLPFWLSWWFFSLIVLVTGVSVFLSVRFFTRRRIRQKERENKFLRSEFTALNALMNPHFVFNSLNSVQSLINKEDLESANQYVRTISDLLRQNMHNISRELISLKKELELIENYLKLEKLRFKDRLQYAVSIAEDVEEEFLLIPPLLIQPLVENAIKYTMAVSEISSGYIRIDTYTEGALTIINVTDNGRGLTQNRKEPGHESTALENIRKRLVQLSQIHKKIYLMTLTELRDEAGNITGTQVRISIEL
jgi:LytS/YehU family sensor histidine kinase